MSAPNAYTVNAPVLDNSATPTLAHDQESLDARAHRDSNEEKKRRTDDDGSLEDGIGKDSIIEEKSKGVQEMESLKERLNVKLLVVIYGCFTILAYCLSVSKCHISVSPYIIYHQQRQTWAGGGEVRD